MQVSKSTSELFQFFRVVKEEAAYPVLTLADEVVGWEEGESGVIGHRSQVMLTSLDDLQLHMQLVVCSHCLSGDLSFASTGTRKDETN